MSETKRRQAPPPPRRFLTYQQLMTMLGYASRQGVWRAVKRGDLPEPVKAGGITRFDEDAVLAKLRGAA